jgi:hypothetical protein
MAGTVEPPFYLRQGFRATPLLSRARLAPSRRARPVARSMKRSGPAAIVLNNELTLEATA